MECLPSARHCLVIYICYDLNSLLRKCPKVIFSCVTQCVKESSLTRCCILCQALCQFLDIYFCPQQLTNRLSIYMAFSHRNLSCKQQCANGVTPQVCCASNASSRSMVGRETITKRQSNQPSPTVCIRGEQGADTSTPQNNSGEQQLSGDGRNHRPKSTIVRACKGSATFCLPFVLTSFVQIISYNQVLPELAGKTQISHSRK